MTEITRRTALTAATWSIPAVTLAVAAPAAAASGSLIAVPSWTKQGGQAVLTVVNAGPDPIPLQTIRVDLVQSPSNVLISTTYNGNYWVTLPDFSAIYALELPGYATVAGPITVTWRGAGSVTAIVTVSGENAQSATVTNP